MNYGCLMRGCVELWLPNDRFRGIMVALLIASSYLRMSILSVFYGNNTGIYEKIKRGVGFPLVL